MMNGLVAREDIAGYGGHILERDGSLVLLLTDTSHAGEKARVFEERHSPRGRDGRQMSITRLRKTTFDFDELHRARTTLRDAGIPGITAIAVAEERNPVAVYVASHAHAASIRAASEALGLPAQMLSVRFGRRL